MSEEKSSNIFQTQPIQLTASTSSSNNDKDAKSEMNAGREERSMEIRDSKRKNLLQRNRLDFAEKQLQIRQSKQNNNQAAQESSSLPQGQILENQASSSASGLSSEDEYVLRLIREASESKDSDSFEIFKAQCLPFDLFTCHSKERLMNYKVLLLAMTHLSPMSTGQAREFFVACGKEFGLYFNIDDNVENTTTMEEMYQFIDLILHSQFIFQAKDYVSNAENLKNDFEIFTIYLVILSGVTRGRKVQCEQLQRHGFLPILSDIFIAVRHPTSAYAAITTSILIFAIGNLMATKIIWRVYFMKLNFHNHIFELLATMPKTVDYFILHHRILWCLSNSTRDIHQKLISGGSGNFNSLYLCEETAIAESEIVPDFDLSFLNSFYQVYLAYDKQDTRCDVAWSYTSLISIIFENARQKANPQNLVDNYEAMELYQQIVSQEMKGIIDSGFCEFLISMLNSSDVTSLIPIFAVLNLILGSNAETLASIFDRIGTIIEDRLAVLIVHRMKIVQKKAIKTAHYLIVSDCEAKKQNIIAKILPNIMGVLLHSIDEMMNDEIYQLLNSIFDSVNSVVFSNLVLNRQYSLLRKCAQSLKHMHVRPHNVLVILDLLIKILAYFPDGDDAKKPIISYFESDGVMSTVESFQKNQSVEVYERSVILINMFNESYEYSTTTIQEETYVQDDMHTIKSPAQMEQLSSSKSSKQGQVEVEEEQIQTESQSGTQMQQQQQQQPSFQFIYQQPQAVGGEQKPSTQQKLSDYEKLYENAKI